jgi:hypothetical protein
MEEMMKMLKACIEITSTGETQWFPIPSENLDNEVSKFVGDRDWDCVYITGLKENGITMFPNNNFYKCRLDDFNYMLLQANDFQYTDENLTVLNLLLEHYNYDCNDVVYAYEQSLFTTYINVNDFGDVAMEYLERTEWPWYKSLKENNLLEFFDFTSYGVEILSADGDWLHDKYNKIMVKILD